jgi:hypothetical protein
MTDEFDDLLRATARLLAPAELRMAQSAPGARGVELVWQDRRLLVLARAERPDRFTLFCDVGPVSPPLMPSLSRRLLESNLVLAERGWGCWGIAAASGHLIYATGGQVSATSATELCQLIECVRVQAAHWQISLLQEPAQGAAPSLRHAAWA